MTYEQSSPEVFRKLSSRFIDDSPLWANKGISTLLYEICRDMGYITSDKPVHVIGNYVYLDGMENILPGISLYISIRNYYGVDYEIIMGYSTQSTGIVNYSSYSAKYPMFTIQDILRMLLPTMVKTCAVYLMGKYSKSKKYAKNMKEWKKIAYEV